MSRCGDVYENKVTGEYAVILRATEDRGWAPALPTSRHDQEPRSSASTSTRT
jgi:hypothetical protein